MKCQCDEIGDYGSCPRHGEGTEWAKQQNLLERPILSEKEKNHIWRDIKAKLLIVKMLGKIRSQRKKLRWIHCANSLEEYAELKCANSAFIEVLQMAVPQKPGRKTIILKTEGGEESEALLIPREEVESVLSRYGYQKNK